MTASTRLVQESPVYQGTNEQVAYVFQWGSIGTPSVPTVTLYDRSTMGTLGGTAYLSGATTVTDTTNVTTPKVLGLTAGKEYLLNCQAVVNGNTFSANVVIIGEI